MKRINAIDFTRGLVMIIMALDHTRDMIHAPSVMHSPTDLATTTPAIFFTRWITHLCAPIFVFLSGSSAYISFKKKNNVANSRRFLLTRGIWLIILEITLVNLGLFADIHFRMILLQVMFAIGSGFILLSLFLKRSIKVIAIVGLIIIFGCGLLQYIPQNNSVIENILFPFFLPQFYTITPHFSIFLAYPAIPWFGIMLAGFATGKLFELPLEKRNNIFIKIGLSAIGLFILLRFINVYGDPSKWSVQKSSMFTFLSFMKVTKYAPSLLYSLITLGIMFLILSVSENFKNRFSRIVIVYGKVPLFYYLIHFYIIHIIMFAILYAQGFQWSDFDFTNLHFGRPDKPSGLPLWGIYIVWISVVIFLYPFCKWYGDYKLSHPEKKWLRYL